MNVRSWIRIPYDAAWRLVMENEGLELSGYIAFSAFLALFPFLIFLASLTGYVGDADTAADLIDAMFSFMPNDVAATLAPAVREVVATRQGGLLTVGLLATLWFSSNGVEALRAGLNRAYKATEQRPIWWLRLQSIGFVICGGLVVFFITAAVVVGPVVWQAFGRALSDVLETRVAFVTLRYVFAIVLLFAGLLVLHRWLPNTRQAFARVIAGVAATVVLWLVGASLFSWYLGNLADYSAMYGSLGGVAITLIFFYYMAVIFQFGASINAVWRERTGRRDAPQETNGEGEDSEDDPKARTVRRKPTPPLTETHSRAKSGAEKSGPGPN